MSSDYTKILLEEHEMPTRWYNIVPDLPEPPPPLAAHPATETKSQRNDDQNDSSGKRKPNQPSTQHGMLAQARHDVKRICRSRRQGAPPQALQSHLRRHEQLRWVIPFAPPD